jgi:hypothetical protein
LMAIAAEPVDPKQRRSRYRIFGPVHRSPRLWLNTFNR